MAFQLVGRPIKRIEDPKLITGGDRYVNDVPLANALTLAFVRSPHAHALINDIDTRAVKARPGIGSTPAIANAVIDALTPLGVTHVNLPLTARKIWGRCEWPRSAEKPLTQEES